MKLAFSLAVLGLITMPITIFLIKKFDPPMWLCFVLGFAVALTVTTIQNKIWDLFGKYDGDKRNNFSS